MNKIIDITGMVFGQLTITGYYGKKNNSHYWKCLCSCGKEVLATKSNLMYGKGKTVSCGCRKRKAFGHSSANMVYKTYELGALKRDLFFDISMEFFLEITAQNCYYCGTPPSNIKKSKGLYGEFIYSGIDRVDNFQGYTEDNVVPCCKICNYAKKTLSQIEFKEWAYRVSSHMLSRELFGNNSKFDFSYERINYDARS